MPATSARAVPRTWAARSPPPHAVAATTGSRAVESSMTGRCLCAMAATLRNRRGESPAATRGSALFGPLVVLGRVLLAGHLLDRLDDLVGDGAAGLRGRQVAVVGEVHGRADPHGRTGSEHAGEAF